MNNDANFEQQFSQNVKSSAAVSVAQSPATASVAPSTQSDSPKLPWVLSFVFAIITLVESVALTVLINNYNSLVMGESYQEAEISEEEEEFYDEIYRYDDDFNLTAFDLACTAENGSFYIFNTDNEYEQYHSADSLAASGPYTITNDSLISLSGSNKVLYYDGFDIADGLTIYTCQEVTLDAASEE